MSVNPFSALQEQQYPNLVEQPQGDRAATGEDFKPKYSKEIFQSMVDSYKQNPAMFNEEAKDQLRKHSIHYNMPFYEGDFSLVDAFKQLGGGLVEGFTTLGFVDPPDNEYEAIIRNIGHLIGFAPGILNKPLKLLGAHNTAVGALARTRSIPMVGADWLTKKAKKIVSPTLQSAISKRAEASKLATGFLMKPSARGVAAQVAEGAFHLGAASAISSWQQGIDGMLESALGGAIFGGGFAGIGNLFPGKNAWPIKAFAGSLFQGLPATMRGATTPEQVYEYLMGAYFGGESKPWYALRGEKWLGKKYQEMYGGKGKEANVELAATHNPEKGKGWDKLDPLVQKYVKERISDDSINSRGEYNSPHYERWNRDENATNLFIKTMGIKLDEFGEPTKESYKEFLKMENPKAFQENQAMSRQTERDYIELADKKFDIRKRMQKLQEEAAVAEEPLKQELKDKYNNLAKELSELQDVEVKMAEAGPREYFDRMENKMIEVEDRSNDGNDIGMFSGRTLERTSEQIVKDNNIIKNVWDKPEYSINRKRNEMLNLAGVVQDVLNSPKNTIKMTVPDTDVVAKEIEQALFKSHKVNVTLDEPTKLKIRQDMVIRNFGKPVDYLRVNMTEKGPIVKIPKTQDGDLYTLAGNRKEVYEPIKAIEDAYRKHGGKEQSHIIMDTITMNLENGKFRDMSLSDIRGNHKYKEDYPKIIRKVMRDMIKKDYYPFGGRGDGDLIIFVKKHPNLKRDRKKVNDYIYKNFSEEDQVIFREALKRGKGWRTTSEAREEYISNILYDLDMNGFEPYGKTGKDWNTAINNLMNKNPDFHTMKNATAWNKRNQIWFTPAWEASPEYVKEHFYKLSKKDRATLAASSSREYMQAIDKGEVNFIIFRPDTIKDKVKPNSKNVEYEEHTDGPIIVEDTYLDALVRDSGMHPLSGESKSFIVSPNKELGAMLGKYQMENAGPEQSAMMRKKGIHMMMADSAVKQQGERKVGDYNINWKTGELEINAPIYQMPIKDVKYNFNVKNDPHMYNVKKGIPKQMLTAMSQNAKEAFSPELIADFYNETVFKHYQGKESINKLVDAYLEAPEGPQARNTVKTLRNNLENIGIEKLLKAINEAPTEFADVAYLELMKINRKRIQEFVADGELTHKEAEIMENELLEFNSAMDRILEAGRQWSAKEKSEGRDGSIMPVLMHKYVRPYRFKVIKSHVFNAISRPTIENSLLARMRSYDKELQKRFPELNENDKLFYLDDNYRETPLNTWIPNYEKTTLGKLWDAYNGKGKNKLPEEYREGAKEIFRAATTRVPLDSVSGVQVLEFGGFTGRKGFKILMHSRPMRAEGGADLDGDEAFVFFGGQQGGKGGGFKKSWKDAFDANRNEFLKNRHGLDPARVKGPRDIGGDYFYDNKHKGAEEYLTIQDSVKDTGINPKHRDSNIWKYDSAWRQELSERAVDGRNLLGSASNMVQLFRAAHSSTMAMKDGKITFREQVLNKKTGKPEWIEVTIKARTKENELQFARELASSMIAFTSDPLDVAGLTGASDYFNKLHKAYFEVEINKRDRNKWDKLEDFQRAKILKSDKGIYGQLSEMHSAIFSKDYRNSRDWSVSDIKSKTNYVNDYKTFANEALNNTFIPKLAKLANKVNLQDSPYQHINMENLKQAYAEHERMIEAFPEITKAMDRDVSTVKFNKIIKVGELLTQPGIIEQSSESYKAFSDIVSKSGSAHRSVLKKGIRENYKNSKNKIVESKRKHKRRMILDDILRLAEDALTNDISDMVTFRQLTRYANFSEVNPILFAKMLKEADSIKAESWLKLNDENFRFREKEGNFEEFMTTDVKGRQFTTKQELINSLKAQIERKMRLESKVKPSMAQTQAESDARILDFKKTLPNNRAKKLFDMMLLGSYRKGNKQKIDKMLDEMTAKASGDKAMLEAIATLRKAGFETSVSKLGFSSKAVDTDSVIEFVGDFSSVMSKAYKPLTKKETNEFKTEFDKDPLLEKDMPESNNRLIEDTTTGFEGLHGKPDMKKINRKTRSEITELVSHLKEQGIKGEEVNEVLRGITGGEGPGKNLNTFTLQDFKDANKFFREYKRGTFWQRLFNEDTMEMRKRYHMLFPATVAREMMKYQIDFLPTKGLYITKAGNMAYGDVRKPTNVLKRLQLGIDLLMGKSVSKGNLAVQEYKDRMAFVDSLPEGEALRNVAIREYESRQSENLYDRGEIEAAQRYKISEKETKKMFEFDKLENKLFTITEAGPDGTPQRTKLTGREIVEKIKEATKETFNKIHKDVIEGNEKLLEKYRLKNKDGSYSMFDYQKKDAAKDYRYDIKRLTEDIYKAYNEGKDITTEFGLNGLNIIGRASTIQLRSNKKDRIKLLDTLPMIEKWGYLEHFFPHMFHDKKAAMKALEPQFEAIRKDKLLSGIEKRAKYVKLLMKTKLLTGDWDTGIESFAISDKVIEDIKSKQNTAKNTVRWEISHKNPMRRESHIPGHSIDASVPEVYIKQMYDQYYRKLAQITSRHIIDDFHVMATERGWGKERTPGSKYSLREQWTNFLKLYIQDAMGNPNIIPEQWLEDPGMKLKGTPYGWWSDNKVADKLNKISKSLGIGSEMQKKYGLDKFNVQDVRRFSNIEAKFELMSLLAHPKSAINNIFGGSLHTIQSAGATNLKLARDYNYLRTINPKWTNNEARKQFALEQGIFPELLMHEWGLQKELQGANTKAFLKDVGSKLSATGQMKESNFRDLAKKYRVGDSAMKVAAKFMSVPETALRTDAFFSHYIKAWQEFGGALPFDHPIIIQRAKKGVKATQFLYSAPFRPGFARSGLGKVMTRFQLWSWNAVRFRNDVIREAKLRGYKQGTPEFEKFKRTAQIDLLTFALASVFAMSMFENVLPAPLSYFKETSEWLFGDEEERNKAFFGMYPTKIAPLQMITPPIARGPLSALKQFTNDDYTGFTDYTIYTLFPFGRLARDISPYAPGNIITNPYRMVEKFTGFPYGQLQGEVSKRRKKPPYHPKFPVLG